VKLTILPAVVAGAALVAAIVIAHSADHVAAKLEGRHPRIAAGIGTVARAVEDTDALVLRRGDWRSLFGAVAYLFFDVLVLWTAFFALHAHNVPAFAPVLMMAYIIGALGGSLPLPLPLPLGLARSGE
jgi:asparagine N-glycosylation enzyme membrane subunit Stt3